MAMSECLSAPTMGLAAGGKMRQEIYGDEYDFDVWDLRSSSRCFVTLLSAGAWAAITGEAPPTEPITAATYRRHGIPWYDYYAADRKALEGAVKLAGLKSIGEFGKAWQEQPISPAFPIDLGPDKRRKSPQTVREAEL